MKRAQWSRLRFRLVLLVMLGGLPAFGLIVFTAAEQRRLSAAQVQENSLRMARLASASQEQLIEGARQALLMLSRMPEVKGDDPEAANALLSEILGMYPLYANFGVIRPDGSVFASGMAFPALAELDLSDRSYFLRAFEQGDFAMGDYQIGRITGVATVNFAHPVRDGDGRVVRVVYSALDLKWLEALAEESDLPKGGMLLVVDRRGTVLVHYPDSARWQGQSILNNPGLAPVLTRGEGTIRAPGMDGETRLFAFTPLRGAEGGGVVSVGIGIPESLAYAEANRMMARNLSLLGLVAGLVLIAAWVGSDVFVLRQVRALLNVIGRMQKGDLSARTGVGRGTGELHRLAAAFDGLADSLEQRVYERKLAEEELRTLNLELEKRVAERTWELDEKNHIMQEDLDLAREFQTSLLPEKQRCFPSGADKQNIRLRFHHQYQASNGVSGDFYEILEISDHQAGLFLCDVMGHGIRAALGTAIIKGVIKELRPHAGDPGRFVMGVHQSLYDIFLQTQTTMFAAAFYAMIDVREGVMRYSNAGNPGPLVVRTRRGEVEPLPLTDANAGSALGLVPDTTYGTGEVPLAPGDLLLVFTDGLFEVPRSDGTEFGEDRLTEAVRRRMHLPPEILLQDLVKEIRAFAADREFLDDICMVGVEVMGNPDDKPAAPQQSG